MFLQFGWQGSVGVLVGQKFICTGDHKVTQGEVGFCGADDGDDQLAHGYRCCGSGCRLESRIIKLRQFPRVMFAVFASL